MKMMQRLTRLGVLFVLMCGVCAFVIADDRCAGPSAALRPCVLPGDYDRAVLGPRENRHDFGLGTAPSGWQFGKHRYMRHGRGTKSDFGFVRKGEHRDFAITNRGLRLTLKF